MQRAGERDSFDLCTSYYCRGYRFQYFSRLLMFHMPRGVGLRDAIWRGRADATPMFARVRYGAVRCRVDASTKRNPKRRGDGTINGPSCVIVHQSTERM